MTINWDKLEDWIIELQKAKNNELEEKLYNELYDLVMNISGKYLVMNAMDVEDCVANFFLHFFAKEEYKDYRRGNIKGWILRVICNHSIDCYRKLKLRGGIEISSEIMDINQSLMETVENEDKKEISEKGITYLTQNIPTIKRFLINLDPKLRKLMRLKLGKKMSYKEIEKKLGYKKGCARVAWHRIVKKLRKEAERYRLDEGKEG